MSANGAVHPGDGNQCWMTGDTAVLMGQAFSPRLVCGSLPGALPQAGMRTRLWRWKQWFLPVGNRQNF
jgi:hypothetical protein